MKGINKLAVALVFGLLFGSTMQLHAGNEQRVGQAGATQFKSTLGPEQLVWQVLILPQLLV